MFTLFRVCVCFRASYSGVSHILSYWGCYIFGAVIREFIVVNYHFFHFQDSNP